jgi:hypothetical protein
VRRLLIREYGAEVGTAGSVAQSLAHRGVILNSVLVWAEKGEGDEFISTLKQKSKMDINAMMLFFIVNYRNPTKLILREGKF